MALVRVGILQPVVPTYRVPVFAQLAAEPDLDVEVWASESSPGSPPTAAAAHSASFRLRSVDTARYGPFLSQPAQLEAVRGNRFDVVILSWNTRYLQLFPALALARRLGVRTINWGHGKSPRDNLMRKWLRNSAGKLADGCLLYSDASARQARSHGIDENRIFVAPNALDQSPIRTARLQWNDERLADFKHRHGMDGKHLIVCVCRMTADKRIDFLMHAVSQVRHQVPNVILGLIGDGPEMHSIASRAKSLGNWVMMPGAMYEEESLAPWLLSADVYAIPRMAGLTILHAFGYGLPVVTSDDARAHGPEIEAVVDGVNGLLYRDGDVAEFAAKLGQLLTNERDRHAMSKHAEQTVGPGGYTVERMVAGMAGAIRAVAGARGGHI
jgi:glycosyltransferase involved in cell wall biosynthesis